MAEEETPPAGTEKPAAAGDKADAAKPGSAKAGADAGKALPQDPIIAAATASMASMFQDVIAAVSKDAVGLIGNNPVPEMPALNQAVTDLTKGMLSMLAARVGETMPGEWPPKPGGKASSKPAAGKPDDKAPPKP